MKTTKNLKCHNTNLADALNCSQVMAFLDQFSQKTAKIVSIIYILEA